MKSNFHVLNLLLGTPLVADEGRIAHQERELVIRDHVIPVHPERIAFHDIRVGLKRQEVQVHQDDAFRFLHHLAFRDP